METKAMLSPLAGATTVVNRRIETGLLSDFVVGDDGEDLLIGGAGDDVWNGMALAARESQSAGDGGQKVANDCEWRQAA